MSAILETPRLILRPPQTSDVPHFVPLIGDFDVSKNCSRTPHPYTDHHGHEFVTMIAEKRALKQDYAFAIRRKEDDAFIGLCGIHPERGWEIGYWIGKPFWGQGYATEVGETLIGFGFDELGAERLAAEWFHDNPASGRVLEKLGFTPAGETMSNSLARGHLVPSHIVALDRHAYKTRKKRA